MIASKLNTAAGDSLDDLLGERTDSLKPAIALPVSYQPQDFTEKCRKCGGRGSIYSYSSGRLLGPCFQCKGKGSKTFLTSPDQRAAKAASRERSKARKGEAAIEAFKVEFPDVWAWMDGSTFGPAVDMLSKLRRYGSLFPSSIEAARRMIAKRDAVQAERQARVAAAPVADTAGVDRLKAAFDSAIAYAAAKGKGIHLRSPRIIIGDVVIKPAKATSANPGALYVYGNERAYLGKITGGKFFAARECTAEVQAKVLAFIADPNAAAKAYGQETGICCVCGTRLISKWRELGIGPICSQKMGW